MESAPSPPIPVASRKLVTRRFGLRSLIGIMLFFAFIFAWRVWAPPGYIAEGRVQAVKAGMTKAEVRRRFGEPSAIQKDSTTGGRWFYKIKKVLPTDFKVRQIMIQFTIHDRVTWVMRNPSGDEER